MMTALIRLQLFPESSELLAVPVNHVLNLVFTHGQTSALNIFENGAPAGSIALRPHVEKTGNQFDSSGYVFVHFPGIPHQRVAWKSSTELDPAYRLRHWDLNLTLREPLSEIELSFDPAQQLASYRVKQNEQIIADSSLNLNDLANDPMIKDFGMDPKVLVAMQHNFTAPSIDAKRSSVTLKNEKIEAYQLRIRQEQTVLAEIYISQLGQVLSVKTAFGYTLSSDDTSP
jgi:hypothetical protein